MNCVTWNLQWARPKTQRGELITEAIQSMYPDVVCYTEVIRGFVPDGIASKRIQTMAILRTAHDERRSFGASSRGRMLILLVILQCPLVVLSRA